VTLLVNGADRTTDLRAGRAPCLLAPLPAGGVPTARVLLTFGSKLPEPGKEPETIGLLFDLLAPAGLAPEWAPGAPHKVEPPAVLTWWYRFADGDGQEAFHSFDSDAVTDGTGGLRRPGIVRLRRPGGWLAEPRLKDSEPFRYALEVRAERAQYTSWPRVRGIVPNAVRGEHRSTVELNEQTAPQLGEQLRAWRREPGLTLILPGADPTTGRLPLAEGASLTLYEFDGQPQEWTPVDDLSTYGPKDRVFVVDRPRATLRFGDGLQGRLPVPDQPPRFCLRYQIGGGPAGNVAASIVWGPPKQPPQAKLSAINAVPAAGGAEPETLGQTGDRLAEELRRPTRAVTAADYEQLATHVPGVAIRRAHAVAGAHPAHPGVNVPGAVTVYVVPDLPAGIDGEPLAACPGEDLAAPVADDAALARVQKHLDGARLLTQEVFVLQATYQEVTLAVAVSGRPSDAARQRGRIADALGRYLHPLWGGDDGSGWPFGADVSPSALLRVVQESLDKGLQVQSVTVSAPPAAGTPPCQDVRIRPSLLVALRDVSVRFGAGGVP
jgi:predicted phage baseplate assembly protein